MENNMKKKGTSKIKVKKKEKTNGRIQEEEKTGNYFVVIN